MVDFQKLLKGNFDKKKEPLYYHDILEKASDMLLECLNKIDDLGVNVDFERLNGRNIVALTTEMPAVNDRQQVLKIQVPLELPADDDLPSVDPT